MLAILLPLAVMLVLGALVAGAWGTRPLPVSADITLIRTDVDLDQVLFRRLNAVVGAEMRDAERGRYTLASRRLPGWAIVAMILTFPIGLLFLLMRTDRLLNLRLVTTEHGQVLRIAGTVEAHVWRRVSGALAPLVADRQPALEGLDAPR